MEGGAARLASKGFLTAVIERLEAGEVDDPHHACLFTASLNAEHRAMADGYLADHPEVWALLEGDGTEAEREEP